MKENQMVYVCIGGEGLVLLENFVDSPMMTNQLVIMENFAIEDKPVGFHIQMIMKKGLF